MLNFVILGAENKLIAGLLLPFILPSLMLLRKYARQDISHECVVAYIRCRRHDRYYTRTYEIRGQGDKVSNNGCYSEVISVKSLFYIQIGFERLEQLYCEMPSDYNILSNNCKHWSRFLFNKIVDI
jgi:hypothetical protein